MLASGLPLAWKIVVLFVAAVAAGISNGLAGGGTFITFPTLLAVGLPSVVANMSSSVGVLPSNLGGIRGFRDELREHRELLRSLLPACLVGSLAGTGLLLEGSNRTFSLVVPWLIGTATVLFALSPVITGWLRRRDESGVDVERRRSLMVGIFLASVYGGYFGAGMGIILIAVLALTLPHHINVLQGLRVALAMIINSVAGVVFIIRWHLSLQAVAVLLVGAFVGGWLGTILIKRLSPRVVRSVVVVIGAVTTIKLALSA